MVEFVLGFVVIVSDWFEFVEPEKSFQNSQAFCCAVPHFSFRRSEIAGVYV